MPAIPFAIQSYQSASLPISAQRCVNAFAESEPPQSGAKSPIPVFGHPGIGTFATSVGVGPIRGMTKMNDILYVVSANQLYRVNADGTSVLLGTDITGTQAVSMSGNGLQVIVVNGLNGYLYTLSTGVFEQISSPDFHSANTVTFYDSYFVFDWANSNKIFISRPLDGNSYDPLDFASAEVQPDYVVAVCNQQESLLVFGERSIETWYNSGGVAFPFQRYDGATVERGCVAPQSIVKEDNSVFFLGDDLVFYRLNGVLPLRVSTHAIENAWQQYSSVNDAVGFSYTFNGHKFVVLNFPEANATWVYDISTGLWHEREGFNPQNAQQRWRINFAIYCYGKILVGDSIRGQIGFISEDIYTEFDDPIRVTLVGPSIHNDRKRVFFSRFELDMETGVGLTSGQGSDPQVMLDWSDSGGRSWSDLQIWTSLGKIGEWQKRLRWLRLGQARQRIFRVTCSDNVKKVFIAAHADISVGM